MVHLQGTLTCLLILKYVNLIMGSHGYSTCDSFGCQCLPGYYGNDCDQLCPPGHWCYGIYENYGPNPCPAGRYNYLSGSHSTTDCQCCPQGKFSAQEGSSSCQDCLWGKNSFYTDSLHQVVTLNNVDQCTSDTSIRGPSMCVCPTGTGWDNGQNRCNPCESGQISNLEYCYNCQPGKYSNNVQDLQCTECPHGK